MAPEVVQQKAHTSAADIWSVGCLVVEMLTGEHPWAQLTQMQAIFKVLHPFFYRGFASPRRLHVPVIDWSIRETCDPVGYLGRRSRFLNKDVRDRPRGAAERRRTSSAWMVGYQETGGGVRWESWQGDRADDRGYGVRLPPPLTMPRSS